LKDEELMVLLEEIVIETRKEVVGNYFFPKVDHIIEIGKEVVGIFFPPKSSLEASSFMRIVQ
jgi:hypothetical protein